MSASIAQSSMAQSSMAQSSIAQSSIAQPSTPPSPMILSDRLLSLAQDADRAGCRATAGQLLALAHTVFDETPPVRQ